MSQQQAGTYPLGIYSVGGGAREALNDVLIKLKTWNPQLLRTLWGRHVDISVDDELHRWQPMEGPLNRYLGFANRGLDDRLTLSRFSGLFGGAAVGGAQENPLIGTYYGRRAWQQVHPDAQTITSGSVGGIGSEERKSDPSELGPVGNKDVFERQFRGTVDLYTFMQGTGAGFGPILSQAHQRLGFFHIAVGIFDPLPGPGAANRLWAFVRANEYADLLILFENRADYAESQTLTPLRISPAYLRQSKGVRRSVTDLALLRDDRRPEYLVANEYLARAVAIILGWTQGADMGNLRPWVEGGALGVDPAGPQIRWAVPCLYPLETASVAAEDVQRGRQSIPDLVALALRQGHLCADTVISSARRALVFVEAPRDLSIGVVRDIQKSVMDATGLQRPELISVHKVVTDRQEVQVLVLLHGARCRLLEYYQDDNNRSSVRDEFQKYLRIYNKDPAGDGSQGDQHIMTLVAEDLNTFASEETMAIFPFHRYDELMKQLGR